MHSNGFIREAAVRHLMLFKDGSEIPYLLLRTNDWVPQVRSAAHDAIANRVKPECAEHFVRYLTLVVRLQRLRRADQRALVENIHGLLTGPEARPAMINLINHEVKEIRRASFSILTAPGTANRSEILKIVLKAQDSAIRLAGARAAGGAFDLEQLRATLTAFTQDRFAPIRQIGIRYWATLFPDAAQQPLLQGLMDQSTAVRGEARFHLRDLIGMDFRSFYCDAIANGNVTSLSIAIAGLGETGRSADAKVLLPYLSHRLARIRRAAVAQVMRLGGDAYIASIVERIMDDSRSVSTQARKSLQKYSSRIGAAELWTLLQTQQAPHIRRNLLYLIAMLPKWECIGYLLQTVCDTHGSIAKLAAQFIARWESVYNRSQTTPTREQLHRAQIALETAAPNLPEAVVSTLGFAIRSFKSA